MIAPACSATRTCGGRGGHLMQESGCDVRGACDAEKKGYKVHHLMRESGIDVRGAYLQPPMDRRASKVGGGRGLRRRKGGGCVRGGRSPAAAERI